jgi:cytochrome P450
MQECRERYGDNFSVKFLGFERPMVMISDPAAIKALYTERTHGLPPGRNVFLEPVLGSRSLLLLEGADHLAHRKLMLPPFTASGCAPTSRSSRRSSSGDRVLVAGRALRDPPAHAVDHARGDPARRLRRRRGAPTGALADAADHDLEETASPFMQLIGLAIQRFGGRGPWGKFEAQLKAIDELLYAEIAERRSSGDLGERDDILSMLIQARFEDGSEMADTDLRDQLLTLLLAGHETTATALAWTFDLLLRHATPLARLRESLEAGEEDYLRATISESLRLRPVVPLAGRRLSKDLVADGLTLPAGADVTPAIWLAHTRADAYPEPFAFRPERFLEEGPDTYAWIPFGGGVRRCLGAAFAEFEMRIVLREVLTRCELRKASPAPEKIGRRSNHPLAARRRPRGRHRPPPGG